MNVQSEITDKKKAILKSTLRIIRTNGFQGTPISLIAKDAGVAAGTIYHYFENKDAIILELYNTIREEMLAAMFDDINEGNNFKSRFFKGWKNLCLYFIHHPEQLLFIEQYNCSPCYKAGGKSSKKIPVNKFNEFFQYGMDKGFLKKMEYNLVASVVFGGIMTTAKYHITGRYKYNDDDLCKIASIIWDGIKYE
ncbi:MAG: TetR/AcrR family transcriptional regulator [Ginsengibacter sp.]